MTLTHQFAQSENTRIHYLDTKELADSSLTPVLICPGLSETAEEYDDLLKHLLPRRAIVLSFRGRGKSDTPVYGYNLNEHIADIEAVVASAGLKYFHLYGFSRGVSYALGYAKNHPAHISSLLLGDYPAEHKKMPEDWADDYIHNYLIPFNRTTNIRPEAVIGIQRDSTQQSLQFEYSNPVLVMRGLKEDSLVSNTDLQIYYEAFTHIQVVEFSHSGHAIRNTEKEKLYSTIVSFLEKA